MTATTSTRSEPWWRAYQVADEVQPCERDSLSIEHLDIGENDLGPFGGVSGTEWLMGRSIPPGRYVRLKRDGVLWMSDTPAEISDALGLRGMIRSHSAESVLISGLGLGSTVKMALLEPTVQSVTVVEISEPLIELLGPVWQDYAAAMGKSVEIVHDDALRVKWPTGRRWGVAWHDIWPDICTDNLPEMGALHRKYGRRVDAQASWMFEFLKAERRRERDRGWW